MQFKCEFNMDNAAFSDDWNYQVTDIFKDIRHDLVNGENTGKLHDLNGNTIGKWEVTE